MVECGGWALRQPWSDWVVWIPRERNVLADTLANICLDRQQSFAIRAMSAIPSSGNFVTVSDGAARSSTQSSSAAWALLAFDHGKASLVAAGAVLFERYASSLDAELMGLELALGSLLKLSRGYSDLVPHSTQTILDASEFHEAHHHLWTIVS